MRYMLAFLLLTFAVVLYFGATRRSTVAAVLPEGTSREFLAGCRAVLPNLTTFLVPDIHHAEEELRHATSRFPNVICQIVDKAGSDIVRSSGANAVTISTVPALLPNNVVCNVVNAEQSLLDAMVRHAPAVVAKKKVVVCSQPCRLPPGWVQRLASTQADMLQQLNNIQVSVVVITNAALVTSKAIASLRVSFPGVVICAATEHPTPDARLQCQVCVNKEGSGKLAACMSLLGRRYDGPQSVVVEPIVVKPTVKLLDARVTTIKQLESISAL